jgi:hypothetical protein
MLDYLTENADRHHGNYLVRPDGSVVAIDNGLSFWQGEAEAKKYLKHFVPKQDFKTRTWAPDERNVTWRAYSRKTRNSFADPKKIQDWTASPEGRVFFERLEKLNRTAIRDELKREQPWMSDHELDAYSWRVNDRRERLLKYLKNPYGFSMGPERLN